MRWVKFKRINTARQAISQKYFSPQIFFSYPVARRNSVHYADGMNATDAKRFIEMLGGATVVAQIFGCTPTIVRYWARRGMPAFRVELLRYKRPSMWRKFQQEKSDD